MRTLLSLSAERANDLIAAHARLLEMMATGEETGRVLAEITTVIESLLPGTFCSILRVDKSQNVLRFAAGPSMPEGYDRAVDGIPAKDGVGCCGTAVATCKRVIVPDISVSPLWDIPPFPGFALENGLRSCWSEPIVLRDNDVVGTFAIYGPGVAEPTDEETQILELAARFAGIAIVRGQTDDSLRAAADATAQSEKARDGVTRQFDALVSQMPVGVVQWTRDFTITSWSPAAARIFGWTADEIRGKNASVLVPPDESPVVSRIVEDLLGNRGGWQSRNRNVTKDGRVILCDWNNVPFVDDAGVTVGFMSICEDVTDRVQAEQLVHQQKAEAEAAKQRLRDMIAGLDVLVWEVDLRAEVMSYLGGRVDEMLGVPEEKWHSKLDYFAQLIAPEDREKKIAFAMQEIAAGRSHRSEYRIIRPDGRVVWVQEIAHVIKDDTGVPSHLRGVTVDITDRKAAEAEIKRARDAAQRALQESLKLHAEAQAANRTKDHFLAALSHELRTPLTPVLATVNLLEQRTDLHDSVHEELAVIRRNVEMEARLIDDLLDLTRISRGKVELHPVPVDVQVACGAAVKICQDEIDGKKIVLKGVFPPGPLFVRADPARLQQVLWNVLKNAVKFTPVGGAITIRKWLDEPTDTHVTNGASFLNIEVIDTGIGIAPDVMPRLFNAFEQGDRSITRTFGGLGLGLAISRALVEMHGGTIVARSDGPGRGATFAIRWPLTPGPAPQQAPRTIEAPILSTPTRVLLVEDHPDTLRVMSRLLRASGFLVKTAPNFASALEAGKEPFDLLVSDLGLPDGTGLDLPRALRVQGATNFEAIALSGYGMDEDVSRSRDAGFVTHLIKPVNFDEFERTIRDVLRK